MNHSPDKQPEVRAVWWKRWLVNPIIRQLKHGTDPNRISWAISLGAVTGLFPILGTPSLVCLLAGWLFKLNHPIMQAFKEVVYPLHLASILVFIRMGERLFGQKPIPFSIPELVGKFKDSPSRFFHEFGMAALEGVFMWLLIAPVLAVVIKHSVKPIVSRVSRSMSAGKEVPA